MLHSSYLPRMQVLIQGIVSTQYKFDDAFCIRLFAFSLLQDREVLKGYVELKDYLIFTPFL